MIYREKKIEDRVVKITIYSSCQVKILGQSNKQWSSTFINQVITKEGAFIYLFTYFSITDYFQYYFVSVSGGQHHG